MSVSSTSGFAELKLDPGPRPRRKAKVTVTCFMTALLILGSLMVVLWMLGNVGTQVHFARGPHVELYQDMKVPYKQNEVVRPLVERNQTFSVVATVWIREPNSEGAETEESMHLAEAKEGGPLLKERVLFSETVFRDLRVEDNLKDIKTVARLKIPTAVFKSQMLWSYDLRASFVLIPDTPSPLDLAVNYSSWIPESINYPAVRPWSPEREPSLKDRIIDSYGTFISLLKFRPINSTCLSNQNTTDKPSHPSADKYDEGLVNDKDGSTGDEMDDISESSTEQEAAVDDEAPHEFLGKMYTSTMKKAPFQAHPHIITRTHLRVVDMSKLYNRRAYEKHHRELRSKACGQGLVDGKQDWRMCHKRFEVHGNSETRIRLRIKDEKSQASSTEWAYGPYLTLSSFAWGPLDLVKVPVNRESCEGDKSLAVTSQDNEKAPENDFVNVDWNIAFSARTPGKLFLADTAGLIFSVSDASGHPEMEQERQKAHEKFEFVSGVTGHRINEDGHPRFYLLLLSVHKAVSFILALLNFHYWYTRASTIGISTRGNLYIACAALINITITVVAKSTSTQAPRMVFSWLFTLLRHIPLALTPLMILKAVLRLEFKWRVIPLPKFARATHGERASERVEARLPLLHTILAFAALSALSAYTDSTPPPTASSQGLISTFSTRVQPLFLFPALTVGRALQLVLNWRLKSFAGTYRPASTLSLVLSLLRAAMGLTYVVGRLPLLEGFSLPIFAELTWATVLVYQAMKYPLVLGQEEEDDSVR